MTMEQKIFISSDTKAIDLLDWAREIGGDIRSKDGHIYLYTHNKVSIEIVINRGKLEDGYGKGGE